MKLKTISMSILSCAACLVGVAHANEVQLKTNKDMQVSYRIAHQNQGGPVVLSDEKTIRLSQSLTIPVDLEGYEFAGVVPTKLDGHVLPDNANHFNQPEQCTMATNKSKTSGTLDFEIDAHQARCATHGGVFG